MEIVSAEVQTAVEAAVDLLTTTELAEQSSVSDGGGATYLWIGANDETTEGTWLWDGNNDGENKLTFGTATTSNNKLTGWTPETDTYDNWGEISSQQNEPDDYQGQQDYAAIALTNWPNGFAKQWNDIAGTNTIGFIIELE